MNVLQYYFRLHRRERAKEIVCWMHSLNSCQIWISWQRRLYQNYNSRFTEQLCFQSLQGCRDKLNTLIEENSRLKEKNQSAEELNYFCSWLHEQLFLSEAVKSQSHNKSWRDIFIQQVDGMSNWRDRANDMVFYVNEDVGEIACKDNDEIAEHLLNEPRHKSMQEKN